jgi:RHS repeat-associated protein
VFLGNTEKVIRTGPDALLPGSPQNSVKKATFFTAIGRPIQAVTYGPQEVCNPPLCWVTASASKERAIFGYDALGHMSSMIRYEDPTPLSSSAISAGSNPVTTTWHYDSLGQVLEFDEPESAAQFRNYSNWSELMQVQWCDATTSPCTDRRTITSYDALGRITHSEDRINNLVDPATVNDYAYDQPATFVNLVTPTNVHGRLASASWPTGRVSFSYDGLGRVNARGFDDGRGNNYIEKHTYHGDGSPSELHLLLPDNGFKDERVDYTYDSAGRLRTARYSDGANTSATPVFNLDSIDLFGRVRQARVGLFAGNGPASYSASYADTGRRLLQDVRITSATEAASREISYQPVPGTVGALAAYDPLGRERVRREIKNGTAAPASVSTYDALGRLEATFSFDGNNGSPAKAWQFGYDSLGNLLAKADLGNPAAPGSATLSYQSNDRDRICSIGYGTTAPSTVCDVKYDGRGNIVEQGSVANGTRKLEYFANGQVKKITDGKGNAANFRYDAFGGLQQLDLAGNTPDTRHDQHFGGLIAVRGETTDGTTITPVITRTIPAPGFSITRHGAAGPWITALGDGRGNRFFLEKGEFVQEVSYQPYGEATSTGQLPHSPSYSSEQWNDGDALTALGLSQLGARIYDPVIGRFLSRDPILIPRTAATTNPYAFAMNDPMNSADPTGLDNGAECLICQPPPFDPLPGYLPSFPAGPQHSPSGGSLHHKTAPQYTPLIINEEKYRIAMNSLTHHVDIPVIPESYIPGQGPSKEERELIEWQERAKWFPLSLFADCHNLAACRYTLDGLLALSGAGELLSLTDLVAEEGVGFGLSELAGAGTSTSLTGLRGAYGLGATVAGGADTVEAFEGGTRAALPRALPDSFRSRLGGTFSKTTNAAGGTVWTSVGKIDEYDFADIVSDSYHADATINIITEVHGGETGAMLVDRSLFWADMDRFGELPGVRVYPLSLMNDTNVSRLLNGPGVTIGAFCNSAECLKNFLK